MAKAGPKTTETIVTKSIVVTEKKIETVIEIVIGTVNANELVNENLVASPLAGHQLPLLLQGPLAQTLQTLIPLSRSQQANHILTLQAAQIHTLEWYP